MDINFKPAEIKHLDVALKMMQDFHAIDEYPFDENIIKPLLLSFINNENSGRFWLIEVDEKIAGYIVLAFGFSFEYLGRDAFIDEFYIEENFRDQGVGQRVLDFVFKEAKMLNIKVLHLELEKHNMSGYHLYLKNGFKDNNRFLLNKIL